MGVIVGRDEGLIWGVCGDNTAGLRVGDGVVASVILVFAVFVVVVVVFVVAVFVKVLLSLTGCDDDVVAREVGAREVVAREVAREVRAMAAGSIVGEAGAVAVEGEVEAEVARVVVEGVRAAVGGGTVEGVVDC